MQSVSDIVSSIVRRRMTSLNAAGRAADHRHTKLGACSSTWRCGRASMAGRAGTFADGRSGAAARHGLPSTLLTHGQAQRPANELAVHIADGRYCPAQQRPAGQNADTRRRRPPGGELFCPPRSVTVRPRRSVATRQPPKSRRIGCHLNSKAGLRPPREHAPPASHLLPGPRPSVRTFPVAGSVGMRPKLVC
jgi:hypothetical protein